VVGEWARSTGFFSMEGCIELAWLVGLIKPHNGPLKSNKRVRHIGWVDAETEAPVADLEIKAKYEQHLLDHCGVRLVEPELFEGYNPHKKTLHRQVAVDRQMAPIELDGKATARGSLPTRMHPRFAAPPCNDACTRAIAREG
jgi:3-oxoacyl-ACP reductase-like protein